MGLARFRRGERGQTTVEYILIVGLISVPLSILLLKILQSVFFKALAKIVLEFTGY